ncbi:hypothetical protein YC2023_121695 [Brassica napus]
MPQLDRSRVSSAKLLSVVVDGDYYGRSSAAVPFKWESQPGTPIRLFKRSSGSDSDFNSPVSAPLTPPPSYFSASPSSTKLKRANVRSGSLVNKNRSDPSSPVASSSSSSSSTSSVPSSPMRTSDSYGRNSRRPMWYGSRHYNAKSSGCYGSIIKLFLRDVNSVFYSTPHVSKAWFEGIMHGSLLVRRFSNYSKSDHVWF